jgi:hypothetical protein
MSFHAELKVLARDIESISFSTPCTNSIVIILAITLVVETFIIV